VFFASSNIGVIVFTKRLRVTAVLDSKTKYFATLNTAFSSVKKSLLTLTLSKADGFTCKVF
jgi:hypothetical protein